MPHSRNAPDEVGATRYSRDERTGRSDDDTGADVATGLGH
jgi:hypothetical protein